MKRNQNRPAVESHHRENKRSRGFRSLRHRDWPKNHALFSKLLRRKKKRRLTEQRSKVLNAITQQTSSKALIKQLTPMSKPQRLTMTIQGWNCLRLKVALTLCNTSRPVKTSHAHSSVIYTESLNSPRIRGLASKILNQQLRFVCEKQLILTLKQVKVWISSNKTRRYYLTHYSAILGQTDKDEKAWQISVG